MKSRTARSILSTTLATTLAFGVLAACSSTRPAGQQARDAAITTKVKAKLSADPEINPFNIDVDTVNGVVTLSGAVRTEQTRMEAERLARNTGDVRDVVNRIEVVPRDD